jgi:hypothetical protein
VIFLGDFSFVRIFLKNYRVTMTTTLELHVRKIQWFCQQGEGFCTHVFSSLRLNKILIMQTLIFWQGHLKCFWQLLGYMNTLFPGYIMSLSIKTRPGTPSSLSFCSCLCRPVDGESNKCLNQSSNSVDIIDILYTLDSASLLGKLKPRIFQRLTPFE